jgi:hypothetical protein
VSLRHSRRRALVQLSAALNFVVDRLDEHDRIYPVHDLDARELAVSNLGEFIDTAVAITGTLLGAGLPGLRDLDAPGMGVRQPPQPTRSISKGREVAH